MVGSFIERKEGKWINLLRQMKYLRANEKIEGAFYLFIFII